MKKPTPILEISFEQYGGAECFFADIDSDGKPEIITYQGPGVFGASEYKNAEHIRPLFPKNICVSAFRFNGSKIWTWGIPNPIEYPYISHAYESCIATGDIDGDEAIEVVIADGDRVVVLDGKTGNEKRSTALPEDNYYIIQTSGQLTEKDKAAIVIKNGEAGYGSWQYGEPVIGLNSELKPVWGPKTIPGGGHHILAMDLNSDGRNEYLIGYCAVGLDGRILWTVDSIDIEKLIPDEQHVDYTDVLHSSDGKRLFAIAGSDKLYLVEEGGRTIFCVPHIHCQGVAIGRFLSDSEYQVALYNAPNGPIVLYDTAGTELWSRSTERTWPMGIPLGCEGRRFHRNRPIVKLTGEKTWIGYADGGWPWAMDGEGRISLQFSPPSRAKQPDCAPDLPKRVRGDDIGYGYALQVFDFNNDGKQEAIIYDRRHLWVYPLQ